MKPQKRSFQRAGEHQSHICGLHLSRTKQQLGTQFKQNQLRNSEFLSVITELSRPSLAAIGGSLVISQTHQLSAMYLFLTLISLPSNGPVSNAWTSTSMQLRSNIFVTSRKSWLLAHKPSKNRSRKFWGNSVLKPLTVSKWIFRRRLICSSS